MKQPASLSDTPNHAILPRFAYAAYPAGNTLVVPLYAPPSTLENDHRLFVARSIRAIYKATGRVGLHDNQVTYVAEFEYQGIEVSP